MLRAPHLLLGDRIWLGRFLGKPFAVSSLAQELYADFDELRGERGVDPGVTDLIWLPGMQSGG